METTEKAVRLQTMLQEALQPILERQKALEEEIKALREEQTRLLDTLTKQG